MAETLAGIMNYIIGAALMAYAAFVLKRKKTEQPMMKIFGLSIRTIITLVYIGIAIDVLLIILALIK